MQKDAWFKILLNLDGLSKKMCKISDMTHPLANNYQNLVEIWVDFIRKRKNSIVMFQVPLNIPPQDLIDQLNLDLGSIRLIFDYKVK